MATGKSRDDISKALKCSESDINELLKRITDEGDKDADLKLNLAMLEAERRKTPQPK